MENQHTNIFEGYLSEDLLDFAFPEKQGAELKLIGVGGGGSNAVNHLHSLGVDDVELIVCNTDAQALENSPVGTKIQLGKTLTRGRGAGSKPDIGREAAIESMDQILGKMDRNTDMVFIAAGMGGGTGTGAAPVIAKKIRELKILTIAIVTVPFRAEIGNRVEFAKKGVEELSEAVDALIVIENEKLNINYADLPMSEAFKKADEVLATAAKSIAEIIKVHGVWNVDFNDVKTVMTDSQIALMGSGVAMGEDRAEKAVEEALNSPLISNQSIEKAKNILINIVSGEKEILMGEHQKICEAVQQISGQEAENFIIGSARDMALGESVKVTLIATGFSTDSIETFREPKKGVLEPDQVPNKKEEGLEISPNEEESGPEVEDTNTRPEPEPTSDPEPEPKKRGWRRKRKKDDKSAIQGIFDFFDDDVD